MQDKTVPQTGIDLSHAGVDAILAALAAAWQDVHYNETDGVTFLDIWLTDLDAPLAIILSWRDNGEGWLLRRWESFENTSVEPDRKWPITSGTPFEVARDVAIINREPSEAAAPEPEPDYWLTLADELRQAADRLATLAGTDWKPAYAALSFSMADPGNKNPIAGDMVDVVACAFGLTAETVKSPGGYYERKASGDLTGLRFNVYGYVPAPAELDDPEKAAMRAELAALRAQVAEGGATR